jgi:hypothetical protein
MTLKTQADRFSGPTVKKLSRGLTLQIRSTWVNISCKILVEMSEERASETYSTAWTFARRTSPPRCSLI